MHIYIYVYIYTYREIEKQREKKTGRIAFFVGFVFVHTWMHPIAQDVPTLLPRLSGISRVGRDGHMILAVGAISTIGRVRSGRGGNVS